MPVPHITFLQPSRSQASFLCLTTISHIFYSLHPSLLWSTSGPRTLHLHCGAALRLAVFISFSFHVHKPVSQSVSSNHCNYILHSHAFSQLCSCGHFSQRDPAHSSDHSISQQDPVHSSIILISVFSSNASCPTSLAMSRIHISCSFTHRLFFSIGLTHCNNNNQFILHYTFCL